MTQDVAFTVPEFTEADRLRKAREHAGLEQAELARDIDVTRQTVGNYERGVVKPRRIVMRAWALRTGVPLEWLETGAVTSNPRPDGPDGGDGLPRLDSNQQPSVYLFPQVSDTAGTDDLLSDAA